MGVRERKRDEYSINEYQERNCLKWLKRIDVLINIALITVCNIDN